MFHIFGALAEFERNIIRERTSRAGGNEVEGSERGQTSRAVGSISRLGSPNSEIDISPKEVATFFHLRALIESLVAHALVIDRYRSANNSLSPSMLATVSEITRPGSCLCALHSFPCSCASKLFNQSIRLFKFRCAFRTTSAPSRWRVIQGLHQPEGRLQVLTLIQFDVFRRRHLNRSPV